MYILYSFHREPERVSQKIVCEFFKTFVVFAGI